MPPKAMKVPAVPAAKRAEPKALDAERFCAEVVAHRHTGFLADIIKAVLSAASTGPSSLRWQILLDPLGEGFEGRRITEDSISLTATMTAERAAGHSWKTLNPTESAVDCHSLLVGWLIEDEGQDPVDALATAHRVTLDDIAGMVGTYEVGHGPKGDGTASGASRG